jgi:hypothetical protein
MEGDEGKIRKGLWKRGKREETCIREAGGRWTRGGKRKRNTKMKADF